MEDALLGYFEREMDSGETEGCIQYYSKNVIDQESGADEQKREEEYLLIDCSSTGL